MNGKQLKNSILQWAIQGKLVPQDPNDEPASVLLKKIRAEKARLVKEGKLKKDKNESIIYRGDDNSYYEKFADGKVKCIDEEIPFEIPSSWCWVRVMNLSEVVRGGSPRPAGSKEFYDGTIPFLKVADLTKDNNMYVNTYSSTIKEAGLKKTRLVKANTLLLSNSGATLGVPKICSFDTTFNDGIAAFLYLSDELKPYMYWFFCAYTDIFRTYNQGTAQPNLNTDIIKSTLVSIPPIKEQQKIVSKLEWLLLIIAKYDKAQQELDQINVDIFSLIKKSLLQEAIKGHLVEQDPKEEAASKLLERIRLEKRKLVKIGNLKVKDKTDSIIFKSDDNKYYEQINDKLLDISNEIPFDIPDSWAWCRFGEYVTMKIGKTPARGFAEYWSDGKYPWASISDMTDYGIITETKEKVSLKAQSQLGDISPSGTLLMSFKLTVGRTSILNIDAYHNEAIISIYPYVDSEHISRDYLFYILPFISNLGESKDAIKGKTLNSKSLYKMLLPIPPLQEQKRIVNRIKELYNKL